MLHIKTYTNKSRFLSTLHTVNSEGEVLKIYRTEKNGVIYYTIEYIN